MEEIIKPVSRDLILAELTPERLLRTTNKGHNLIYIVNAHEAPNTMREIGRLREIAFREAGGGTGKCCDIDEFDIMENPCRQLLVWNPEENVITGAYRFLRGRDISFSNGIPRIATAHMFNFSERFIKEFMPVTIELGRSFVNPEYQSTRSASKALFALDNLWDGLGALTVIYPEIDYLFGKVTMYPNFGAESRDLILYFLHKHFPDPDHLVTPINPLKTAEDLSEMKEIFTGTSFKEDYRILNHHVRLHGRNIPPLVNAYMSLSPTMRMFGTALNPEFGNVEESGIFFKISDIFEEKKDRHIRTYNVS